MNSIYVIVRERDGRIMGAAATLFLAERYARSKGWRIADIDRVQDHTSVGFQRIEFIGDIQDVPNDWLCEGLARRDRELTRR